MQQGGGGESSYSTLVTLKSTLVSLNNGQVGLLTPTLTHCLDLPVNTDVNVIY